MKLPEMLELTRDARVAVSGCGGKTSLIELLAGEMPPQWKILISPTTKIRPERRPGVPLLITRDACMRHSPRPGRQYLGQLNAETGKLESLPPDDLEKIASLYDVALLEADGCQGRPCKGWSEREPAVPSWVTHTTGVVSIKAAGLAVTEDNVFQLAEFLALTGLERNDRITIDALAAMVCSPDGVFRRKAGRTAVVINQAESAEERWMAAELAKKIRASGNVAGIGIIFGSARRNLWEAL
jgi:probable selenium-dependent hydroxylase accessory protein YqeC